MVLEQKIMNLISGITDPAIRLEIARTIVFLFEVWTMGKVREEEIMRDLKDIAYTVITYKNPLLTEDEARRKAEDLAKDIFRVFRLESMYRTSFVRYRGRIMF